MRGSLLRFPSPKLGNTKALIGASAFSTSAGGGGGGGRGRGRGSWSGESPIQFNTPTPGKTESEDPDKRQSRDPPSPSGRGHGRGKPIPSSPILPSFSSFVAGGSGRGRGSLAQLPQEPENMGPKKPISSLKEHSLDSIPGVQIPESSRSPGDSDLPSDVLSVLSGAGRGEGAKPSVSRERAKQENRHLRAQQPPARRGRDASPASQKGSTSLKLSREEAVKKAVGILSRGGGRDQEDDGRRGRGFRGRGREIQNREATGESEEDWDTEDDDDDVDDEKLAELLGPEIMKELDEGLEEMSDRVLPCPLYDDYVDAFHTNMMIECEPEYMMNEYGDNPDIDEKPPISLRDALEKAKPFLMVYEGIQNEEEWEEAVKETMATVPLMKEIVDYYSGPDRVTAKQQQEELERVATTLPANAPASVKQFTNRAVLSLQSNPGWRFDKKCQFMDKLVWEVSQHYK